MPLVNSDPAPDAPEALTSTPDLSLVLPVYEQGPLLAQTLPRVVSYLEERARASGLSWELIVVSDGSRDSSVEVAESFAAREPRCRLITFPENRGKGAAVRAGVLASSGARVLFSDVDLSTPLAEFESLNAALDEGADLAIASRHAPGAKLAVPQGWQRRWLGSAFRALARTLLGIEASDPLCGFKLFTRRAAQACFESLREEGFAFDLELLVKARDQGLRVAEVPVTWSDSLPSTVRPWRDAPAALRRVLALSAPALRERWAEVLLLALAALLLGGRLGARSLWGSEGRWAEAVRWMFLTGDALTPRVDGLPYLLKPAPSYWPAALTSLGGLSEASLRVPSVAAAWATIWATIRLGTLWHSRRAGLLAGAMLLTSGFFAFWARVTSGDMLTVAALALAVLVGERFRRDPNARWIYLLGLICALGSLAKGLLGLVLPAVSLFALSCAAHGISSPSARRSLWTDLRRWWGRGHLLGAGALFALVFLAPFGAERVVHGRWDSLSEAYLHSFGRFVGALPDEGSEGPLFYLYYVFLLAAPWSLWFPLVARRPLKPALAWFLGLLAFFTLSSSRRGYYLLPILPATSILVAGAWLEPARPDSGHDGLGSRLRRAPLQLLAAAGLLGGAALPLVLPALTRGAMPGSVAPVALGATLGLLGGGFAGALWAETRGRRGDATALTLGTLVLGLAAALWVFLPQSEVDRTLRPFARTAAVRAQGASLGVYRGSASAPLSFYLGRPAPLDELAGPSELSAYQGLVLARAHSVQLPPGWRVLLRERPAPESADQQSPAPCARCAARARACKHYLLLGRDP